MFHTDSHPLCKREDCRTGGPILSAIQLKLKTAQEQSHLRFKGLRSRWEKDFVYVDKSIYDSSLPDAALPFPFPVMSRCPWRWFSLPVPNTSPIPGGGYLGRYTGGESLSHFRWQITAAFWRRIPAAIAHELSCFCLGTVSNNAKTFSSNLQ